MEKSLKNIFDQVATTTVKAGHLDAHIITRQQLAACYSLISLSPLSTTSGALTPEILSLELARLTVKLTDSQPAQRAKIAQEITEIQAQLTSAIKQDAYRT